MKTTKRDWVLTCLSFISGGTMVTGAMWLELNLPGLGSLLAGAVFMATCWMVKESVEECE